MVNFLLKDIKMNKKLIEALEQLDKLARKHKLQLEDSKDIPYGVQQEYSYFNEKGKVNIYYSAKKDRISFTVSSKSEAMKRKLNEVVLNQQTLAFPPQINDLHSWKSWVGSDESGKGDYFGPLVVAAFYCRYEDIIPLRELGVKDSKELKDNQIDIVARKVMARYPNNFQQLVLVPSKYNELYVRFKESKKNLNHILAWAHSKVIATLVRRFNPEGVFVDRFTKQNLVEYYLASEKCDNYDIIQAHQGERDVAVATASIIARHKFNSGIEHYSNLYGVKLPKGGGNQTIVVGKEFVTKCGVEKLNEVAKLHFKNSDSIISE